MTPCVLAFLAHPDDAEILCAGTLARLHGLGWAVHIATATPGDCGSTDLPRWDIAAKRVGEATRAAAVLGGRYHCLDERDGLVVYDKPTVRKTLDLFRQVCPDVVLTHAPRDYMVDHEVVSQLARSASFLYAAPNAGDVPPSRSSAGVPHLYYCDPVEGFADATTVIDISEQIDTKTRMLACHASQREWLRAHHGMDEYLDAMRRHSARRGRGIGVAYAEGFVQHRGHPYPTNDLLAESLEPAAVRS